MTTDRWPDVKEILLAALETEPAARDALLDLRCDGDAALRAEVERYLEREGEAEKLIEQPAVQLLAARPPEGREGSIVGAFRLENEIGRGGMGVVYRAQRESPFAQTVAIKILKRGLDTDDIVRRFARERQILSRLEHPAIARILDGGSTPDGLPYLVMEHVDGVAIDQYCRHHALAVAERLRLFVEVCGAVHHAHQNLVVHRDLKPANLLVDPSGRPRLLDFGIAKLLDTGEHSTRTSLRPMTPTWASPEQRAGAVVTTASDVYALGMLLDLLLTDLPGPGAALPSARLARAARAASSVDERRRLVRRARELRGDLDRIVARARHHEPQRRYASAADLAQDIERYLVGRPVVARPDSFGYRLSRLAKRHPWGTLSAGVAFAGWLAFSAAVSLLLARATAARDRAERFRVIALDALDATEPNHPDRSADDQRDKIVALIPQVRALAPTDRAPLLNRLSQSLLRLGLDAEAIELLRQAVAAHEAIGAQEVGSQPVGGYADALNNLGLALIEERETEEGVAFVRAAIEALARDPGDHPRTRFEYMTNLAYGLERSDPEAAETLYREVLVERLDRFGPEDLSVGNASNNLGFLLFQRGDPAQALPLLDEAVRLRRAHLGEDHKRTAIAYSNRAAGRLELGNTDGAIDDARKTLDIRLSLLGKRIRGITYANIRLANALLSRNRPGDLPDAMIQLAAARMATRPDSAVLIAIDRHTAHGLTRQGDAASAEALARDALARAKDRYRNSDSERWRLADLQSVVAGAILAQGRRNEARPLLEASWRALCADPLARNNTRRQANERLRTLDPSTVAGPNPCALDQVAN